MPAHCNVYVRGKRMRITELDSCGNVTAGTSNQVTTDGFITITLSSDVEDGTEITQRNAAGALCVNEKFADSFKRFTVEADFCGVNPDLLSLTTNAEPYEDYAGDVAGVTVAEGEINKFFALELWMGITGMGCGSGEEASGYLLLPFVQAGVMGDLTVDGENAVTFGLTGASTKGGNQWGVGPYLVVYDDSEDPGPVPAVLPTALDSLDHLLLMDTLVAPPAVACSKDAVPTIEAQQSGGN